MNKETVDKYLGAIRSLGGKATAKEVADHVGVAKNSAYMRIMELYEDDLVEIAGLGEKTSVTAPCPYLYKVKGE